jgi:hypothetical protein
VRVYYVCNTRGEYLGLRGPYCYPQWCTFAVNATALTLAQAHSYASAVGCTVVGAEVASSSVPPAPDTQPSVSSDAYAGITMPDGFLWQWS